MQGLVGLESHHAEGVDEPPKEEKHDKYARSRPRSVNFLVERLDSFFYVGLFKSELQPQKQDTGEDG